MFLSFFQAETESFIEREKKFCYDGLYPEDGYGILDDAKTNCLNDTSCGKVYDRNCDGLGPFYLCPKESALYGSHSSCVYEKDEEGKTYFKIF